MDTVRVTVTLYHGARSLACTLTLSHTYTHTHAHTLSSGVKKSSLGVWVLNEIQFGNLEIRKNNLNYKSVTQCSTALLVFMYFPILYI